MPKLPSSRFVVKVLLSRDFVFISQKGSHRKYRRFSAELDKNFTVIVPARRKEIPMGTLKSIARQAGLDLNDFR